MAKLEWRLAFGNEGGGGVRSGRRWFTSMFGEDIDRAGLDAEFEASLMQCLEFSIVIVVISRPMVPLVVAVQLQAAGGPKGLRRIGFRVVGGRTCCCPWDWRQGGGARCRWRAPRLWMLLHGNSTRRHDAPC